jgi:tetratricopeptide (TPR) repeat protein
MRRRLLYGALLLGMQICLSTAPARAADPPAAERPFDAKQEAKDTKVTMEAMEAFGRQGYAALPSRLKALNAVLEHAPASYPRTEMRGGKRIIRSFSGGAMSFAALVNAAKDGVSAEVQFNTYPAASFMVGAYANEKKQPEVALAALERGLKLQPDEGALISEKGAAYVLMERPADALAVYEPWLAAMPLEGLDHRARILRAKGFALIELGRLDEAETAYKESLKLEPGHGGAQRELTYIAEMRAGGQRRAIELQTSKEAAKP